MKQRIVVMVSGDGSNLQAILDACDNQILPNCKVVHVISSKPDVMALERTQLKGITASVFNQTKGQKREDFDLQLANFVASYQPDLIVLAGWMRILTKQFILKFDPGTIINLHPALPGEFPGANSICDAWKSYKNGDVTYSGIMVHEVVEALDAGRVLATHRINFQEKDTFETFRDRIKSFEKMTLIRAIYNYFYADDIDKSIDIHHVANYEIESCPKYTGKVREMIDLNECYAMVHSDRLSAFDRQICIVPGKGRLLMEISQYWFALTRDIIPNHYIWAKSNVMFVQKCKPIPLEIVVRGYITGSTNTSLWSYYAAGERVYSGVKFPDNLKKNQKLPRPVITPTTKGKTDVPISEAQILEQQIVSEKDWETIKLAAMRLYAYGNIIAESRGLILVDTKYEFGWDKSGNVILIDELHTPDSSRYWLKDSYESKFTAEQEPDKIDKDTIRDYLRLELNWDPYTTPVNVVPEIPNDKILETFNKYADVRKRFYKNMIEEENEIDQHTFSQYETINDVCFQFKKWCLETFKRGQVVPLNPSLLFQT